jgi:hypothetical protein
MQKGERGGFRRGMNRGRFNLLTAGVFSWSFRVFSKQRAHAPRAFICNVD